MRREEFSLILGDIDDRYIEEAHGAARTKRPGFVKWGAVAACAAAAVALGVLLARPGGVAQPGPSSNTLDLPKLEVEELNSAGGEDGYWAYSIEELTPNSGWDGTIFDTLPVYKNVAPADSAGVAEEDRETLEAALWEVAGRLGVQDLTITAGSSPLEEPGETGDEKLHYVQGAGGGVTITAYSQQVRVEFDTPVPLPEGMEFSKYSSYDEMRAAGEYLLEKYAGLWGMEDPQVDVRGGGRNIYAEQSYELYIYDAAGDSAERLKSHDLKSALLLPQDGGLGTIWLDNYDLSEKAGDYPIVTPEEAKELLCAGNYLTTEPEAMPGEEYIARVELIYRTERTAKYFMPYYRFLVCVPSLDYTPKARGETEPSDSAKAMHTYGVYYVPAVRGEYLAEMPVWDGSFN